MRYITGRVCLYRIRPGRRGALVVARRRGERSVRFRNVVSIARDHTMRHIFEISPADARTRRGWTVFKGAAVMDSESCPRHRIAEKSNSSAREWLMTRGERCATLARTPRASLRSLVIQMAPVSSNSTRRSIFWLGRPHSRSTPRSSCSPRCLAGPSGAS